MDSPRGRGISGSRAKMKPYHIFRRGGKRFLLDPERLIAGEVSEEAGALRSRLSGRPRLPLAPSVRAELEEPGAAAVRDAEVRPEDPPVISVTLQVTERCNLRCGYCFGGGGKSEMSAPVAARAVDWLIERSRDRKNLSLCFFGGEPLLSFPLIQRVVVAAEERGAGAGKKFSFSITTNAALLEAAQITFLREHDFFVLVSFDGPPAVQDRNRPSRDGRSSYRITVPRIKRLLEVIRADRVAGRATYCGRTRIEGIHRELRALGFPHVDLKPVSPPVPVAGDRAGEKLRELRRSEAYREEFIRHWEESARRFRRAVRERDREAYTPLQVFGKLVRRLIAHRKIFFPCSAGRDAVAIAPDGGIYPCQRFLGMKEYRIGSLAAPRLERSEYLAPPLREREPCSTCWAYFICAGGCYYDNLTLTGDRFVPDPSYCEDTKRLIEMAIELYCGLDAGGRAWLMEEAARLRGGGLPAPGSFFALFQRELGHLLPGGTNR